MPGCSAHKKHNYKNAPLASPVPQTLGPVHRILILFDVCLCPKHFISGKKCEIAETAVPLSRLLPMSNKVVCTELILGMFFGMEEGEVGSSLKSPIKYYCIKGQWFLLLKERVR